MLTASTFLDVWYCVREKFTSKEVREPGSLLKIRNVSVFVLLSSSIF